MTEKYGDDRDDFIHQLPLERIYSGDSILTEAQKAPEQAPSTTPSPQRERLP